MFGMNKNQEKYLFNNAILNKHIIDRKFAQNNNEDLIIISKHNNNNNKRLNTVFAG